MTRRTDGVAKRLTILAVAIVAIFAYGIVGYILLGFGFVDALYMTALALTTAGFNPVRTLTPTQQVFTVTIAILGVSAFIAILTILAGALAEGRLGIASRRRRMQRRIDELRDHFLICAYGRVGRTVSREFEAEGVPFVVIDVKEELEEQMRSDGVRHLIGDPASEPVLRRAGVEHARGLVCAVDSDATNVYITLTARSLNPRLFIVARAREPETADKLRRAGADRVISPYVSSGRHMALLAMRPSVVDYMELVDAQQRDVRLDELMIDEGSLLVGKSLRDACGEAVPLLLARGSGSLVPGPGGDERLEAGDLVLLLGDPGALRRVEGQ